MRAEAESQNYDVVMLIATADTRRQRNERFDQDLAGADETFGLDEADDRLLTQAASFNSGVSETV